MGSTWTIFKREIKVYFTSPIAYVLAVIFLAITGYLFTGNVLTYSLASIQAARNPYIEGVNPVDMVLMPLFGNIGFVLLFLLPVLTMRLFAEEKKSGTSELLFCYPVRDIEILAGKYLAALFVTSLMIGLTGLFLLLLWVFGMAEPGVAFSGYLGMFLLAATFLACGIFISSLTENQIVAAVLTLGVLLAVMAGGLVRRQGRTNLKQSFRVYLPGPTSDQLRPRSHRHLRYRLLFVPHILFPLSDPAQHGIPTVEGIR